MVIIFAASTLPDILDKVSVNIMLMSISSMWYFFVVFPSFVISLINHASYKAFLAS